MIVSKTFPVLDQQNCRPKDRKKLPRRIPWSLAETFRQQAERNHGQTLERLAERGGLSPEEMWMAAHDVSIRSIPEEQVAIDWLNAELARVALRATARPVLYPDIDPRTLGPRYAAHVSALTSEGLHSKAAIAEQLAWRDQTIEGLQAELASAQDQLETARVAYEARLDELLALRAVEKAE